MFQLDAKNQKTLAQEEMLFLVDGTDRSLQFTKQGLSMKEVDCPADIVCVG